MYWHRRICSVIHMFFRLREAVFMHSKWHLEPSSYQRSHYSLVHLCFIFLLPRSTHFGSDPAKHNCLL